MEAFFPEHPKRDQNPKFTPLSEKTSINTHFICGDAEGQNDLKRCNAKKKSKTDKDLYDIEIVQVDKERKRFKIHFVGFGNQFDEWRDFSTSGGQFPFVRLEKSFVPGEESLEDRRHIFHGHLYQVIKRKMWSSQREDPEVRIELPIEPDVFPVISVEQPRATFR